MPHHVIISVHGTFAANHNDTGGAWWQLDGSIAKSIARHRVLVQHFKSPEKCFHWSGQNSLHSREQASEELFDFLQEFEVSKTPYHLIGHSHGGSVIWAMLRRVAAAPDRDLRYLESWLTVGTPFIALKQTSMGIVASKFLTWLTVMMATALCALVLALFAKKFGVESFLDQVPWLTIDAIVIGCVALTPLALYTFSRARDHRPDPGSIIVNTERKELLDRFVSKWFGVWSRSDEAIAALRTSLSNRIAPLAVRPLIDRFSFTRNPFYIRTFFALPSRLFWNLVLRPTGNHVLRSTLRSSSLGIDRPGIKATSIEPWPRIFGNSTSFPSLPAAIDEDLQRRADQALGKCSPVLRKMLADVSVGIDANAALSPKTISLLPSALVHTSYFGNPLVTELIFRWLLVQKKVTSVDSQKIMARNYIGTFLEERRRLVFNLLNEDG
jgi:hypothetical protein